MLSVAEQNAGIPDSGAVLAGRYRIDAVLGRGGMGVVLSGVHTALQQRVAVKFLLPSAAGRPGATERFLREARSAAAIQNEHVARVFDVGMLDSGVPYMVVEHLDGSDLSAVLRARGRLTVVEAVDFVLQAGEALAEAHALGIVHRDLKPSNLFVSQRVDGSPFIKVLDFGLAKVTTEREAGEVTLTTTDTMMGSPPYMAPEQLRSLKHVDARADIWSLGVILYHLLAGKRPFEGDSLTALCLTIVTDPPLSVSAHRRDVPPELDAAILRCLEKNAAERTQSVAALASDIASHGSDEARRSLDRILRVARGDRSGETAGARALALNGPVSSCSVRTTEPSTEQTSSWARLEPSTARRRSSWLWAALALVALLGAGVLAWTQGRPSLAAPAAVVDRASVAAGGEERSAGAPATAIAPPPSAAPGAEDVSPVPLAAPSTGAPATSALSAAPLRPASQGARPAPPSPLPASSRKRGGSDMLDRWQ